jgi:hypothetical protein
MDCGLAEPESAGNVRPKPPIVGAALRRDKGPESRHKAAPTNSEPKHGAPSGFDMLTAGGRALPFGIGKSKIENPKSKIFITE